MRTFSIEDLRKWRNVCWIVGAISAAICLLGALHDRDQFFKSYVFSYLYWFGMGAGCLGFLLIHNLTGGAWGDWIRPALEAGARTLPALALLFIPVLLGLRAIYPWTGAENLSADAAMAHKHLYLNVPFFIGRAILFFIAWIILSRISHDERGKRISAPGLLAYGLTISFALVDWMMSLEPYWYSSIFPVMVAMGEMLGALSLAACATAYFGNARKLSDDHASKPFLDLGNLIMAFVLIWTYMSFSQYLIIWSGNMPEEITWYLHRQNGAWFGIVLFLAACQFVLPFVILLGRRNKARLERLAWIAAFVAAVQLVDTYWLVAPSFSQGGWKFQWLDVVSPVAVGGIWLGVFFDRWVRRGAIVGTLAEGHEPETVQEVTA